MGSKENKDAEKGSTQEEAKDKIEMQSNHTTSDYEDSDDEPQRTRMLVGLGISLTQCIVFFCSCQLSSFLVKKLLLKHR